MRRGLCLFLLVFSGSALQGDGGRVLAEKQMAEYRVVLFGNPTPLRAGLADFSVLLQENGTTRPLLDAKVDFRLNKLSRPTPELAWKGIGCVTAGQVLPAIRGHSGNGLLYSAVLGIPEPGLWELGVSILREDRSDAVSFDFSVDRALPPMATWWPVVALMPLGIFIYIWRGHILGKRRRP